jgi:hypothetical protein
MKQYKVHFEKTDIIFTDPCYFVKDDDIWDKYFEDFAINKSLDKLGCSTGVCIDVGDVVPDILVDVDSGCSMGALSPDGMLGCFRLEDVLAHNTNFAEDMARYPDSALLVKGFAGDVVFIKEDVPYYDSVYPVVTIIGAGTVNFHSAFILDDGNFHYKPDLFVED